MDRYNSLQNGELYDHKECKHSQDIYTILTDFLFHKKMYNKHIDVINLNTEKKKNQRNKKKKRDLESDVKTSTNSKCRQRYE